jgi:hypothetical protein
MTLINWRGRSDAAEARFARLEAAIKKAVYDLDHAEDGCPCKKSSPVKCPKCGEDRSGSCHLWNVGIARFEGSIRAALTTEAGDV